MKPAMESEEEKKTREGKESDAHTDHDLISTK